MCHYRGLGERSLAFLRVKQVVLLQTNPRQCATLASDLVAEPRQLLLARQQFPVLGQSVLSGHNRVVRKCRRHAQFLRAGHRSRDLFGV